VVAADGRVVAAADLLPGPGLVAIGNEQIVLIIHAAPAEMIAAIMSADTSRVTLLGSRTLMAAFSENE